ncbi:MAG: transcription antitermination factor NusB [Myxococcaceae bacterium]
MGARREGRERALQALYQLEMSQGQPQDALEAAWASADSGRPDPDAKKFASELTLGVHEHLGELDKLLQDHSHNWRLDRMTRIDRNVLRLGVYELKYRPDIPRKVTLNEAVELGKTFGNEESSSFINGLLDRIAIALNKA